MNITKKENPCNYYDHLYDTDCPDGCIRCGWTFDEIKENYRPELKGFKKITMNICNHCGLKALRENDMISHLKEKHGY